MPSYNSNLTYKIREIPFASAGCDKNWALHIAEVGRYTGTAIFVELPNLSIGSEESYTTPTRPYICSGLLSSENVARVQAIARDTPVPNATDMRNQSAYYIFAAWKDAVIEEAKRTKCLEAEE